METIETSAVKLSVEKARQVTQQDFETLLRKIPPDRCASPWVVSDWVFNSALASWHEIDPATVPSRGALKLLQWIQGPANYTNFIRNIWAKTIPTKSTVEYETKLQDDGRQQLSMLDDFQSSVEQRAAE